MSSKEPDFPYFVEAPVRDLTSYERDVVSRLVENCEAAYSAQVGTLKVVGRCGCGQCPTVFFELHEPGVQEQELSAYAGRDQEGGLVGAVLFQKNGCLSQLEFYSVDGHDPWYRPRAQNLRPLA